MSFLSKVQQNISGRLTSEQRTKDRYRIRGYLSTAAKHGRNMIDALREAILERPWMPPDPCLIRDDTRPATHRAITPRHPEGHTWQSR